MTINQFAGFNKNELREIANQWEQNWQQGKNTELSAWKGYVQIKNHLGEIDTIPRDLKIQLNLQAHLEETA